MTTVSTRRFDRLTAAQASAALYIDFEGGRDQPPVLLGVLRRRGRAATPPVQQDVLDPAFAGLGLAVLNLREVVEKVVRRAEKGDRRIVAWSEHELDIVRGLRDEDPELVARFEARYVNARRIAERWRNAVHGCDKPEGGRLADYLELIDYVVPEAAAPGSVGETIRTIRPRLERGEALTPGQRERWERLLEHNRHDCAGMRRVCIQATTELDAAERARDSRPRRSRRARRSARRLAA